MQELKFVRTEQDALIVADDAGALFSVSVDDAMLSGIRQIGRRDHHSKASPKKIQSLIRAGKSALEVAEITGAELEDIERFETPVLAERDFMLESALQVTYLPHDDSQGGSFGAATSRRLEALESRDIAWSAWRDENHGWLISCTFTSHDIHHSAIWQFDHKKRVVTPHNSDAKKLSKQGDVGDRLIPKLRAVENTSNHERFDSGAFQQDLARSAETSVTHEVPHLQTVELTEDFSDGAHDEMSRRNTIEELAVSRDEEPVDFGHTADLLDALRRRRGERDTQPQGHIAMQELPTEAPNMDASATGTLQGEPLDEYNPADTIPLPPSHVDADSDPVKTTGKKGRQGMPSWDDILFGTRGDEERL